MDKLRAVIILAPDLGEEASTMNPWYVIYAGEADLRIECGAVEVTVDGDPHRSFIEAGYSWSLKGEGSRRNVRRVTSAVGAAALAANAPVSAALASEDGPVADV